MSEIKNILLIRFKALGDVVFAAPAVHAVREAYPKARITFLTSSEHAPLLEGFQGVDEALVLDRRRLQSARPGAIVGALSLLGRLRSGKFSLVVDFQGYGETGWLAWWSRAPRRWGILYNPSRRWAFTHSMMRNVRTHPIERNLTLLREGGARFDKIVNRFDPPGAWLKDARSFLEAHGLQIGKPLLFIQPYTSTPAKNWPLERQLELARYWRQRGAQVVFGGGPKETEALAPARQQGFTVAAGAPLAVTVGLMKLSNLVLGGDTGLSHLAVAMGRRVVLLLNSTNPGSSVPFQHPDWAVTPPDRQPVAAITTATVLAATRRAFAELGQPLPN